MRSKAPQCRRRKQMDLLTSFTTQEAHCNSKDFVWVQAGPLQAQPQTNLQLQSGTVTSCFEVLMWDSESCPFFHIGCTTPREKDEASMNFATEGFHSVCYLACAQSVWEVTDRRTLTLETLISLRSKLGSHHLNSVKPETLWAKAELLVLENKIKIKTWVN